MLFLYKVDYGYIRDIPQAGDLSYTNSEEAAYSQPESDGWINSEQPTGARHLTPQKRWPSDPREKLLAEALMAKAICENHSIDCDNLMGLWSRYLQRSANQQS